MADATLQVRKSNQIVSSCIKGYSLNQKKLLCFLISIFNEKNNSTKIQASEALDNLNLNSNNYSQLRRMTLSMIKGIEIPLDEEKVIQIPIFHKIYYGNGVLEFQFHEDLLPFITNLKNKYTEYQLTYITRFTCTYSLNIYELCRQYLNTKQKYRYLTLNELKFFLDISANKYKEYKD